MNRLPSLSPRRDVRAMLVSALSFLSGNNRDDCLLLPSVRRSGRTVVLRCRSVRSSLREFGAMSAGDPRDSPARRGVWRVMIDLSPE
jgi:hypothetical protein